MIPCLNKTRFKIRTLKQNTRNDEEEVKNLNVLYEIAGSLLMQMKIVDRVKMHMEIGDTEQKIDI